MSLFDFNFQDTLTPEEIAENLSISVVPALKEVGMLLLVLGVVITLILTFVKLNYKLYNTVFYLPFMAVVSAIAAYGLHLANADQSLVVFAAVIPFLVALYFKYGLRGKHQSPILFAAPAVLGVFILFIYPLLFNLYLAFTKLNLRTLGEWIETGKIAFVGVDNFVNIFNRNSETDDSFQLIFGRTILWTVINIFFHFFFGMILALLMNQKIRFVSVYRALISIPWAAPTLILVLAWRGEFHSSYGFVNQLIGSFMEFFNCTQANGCYSPIEWWTNDVALFASICIVNVWLGIPFYAVNILSGLQSIPLSYYEASSIDGASRWQQFTKITVPLLKPIVVPVLILDMIWTFNNVMVVYLMTAQRGGSQGADILVSDLYKQAFTFYRYSFAAAYAIVIFMILGSMSFIGTRYSKIAESPTR
jgi:arabinogalactan oligomer/maltooligosaccharide transport system permease protein